MSLVGAEIETYLALWKILFQTEKKKKSINLVIFSNVCTQHSDRLGLKNTYEGAEPELMLHFNHCLPETARAGPLKLPFFICFMFPLFYMV